MLSFSFHGPDTLLDDEECLYGGLFIHLRKNNLYKRVWSSCTNYNQLKETPIFVTDVQILITTVEFHQYSKINQFGGIWVVTNPDIYLKGLIFQLDENSLNNGKYLIDIQNFPMNYTFSQGNLKTATSYAQIPKNERYGLNVEVQSLSDKTQSYETYIWKRTEHLRKH